MSAGRQADGVYLRPADSGHACVLPEHGSRGQVWRCVCGRRYTCSGHVQRGGGVTLRPEWVRRLWPWPR